MAGVCGYAKHELVVFSIAGAIDVAAGTGAMWLASDVTSSLVGGALGGIAHLVTFLVIPILFKAADQDTLFKIHLTLELSLPVVFSFAATVLGYPVSIPLALLIGAINIASFFASIALFELFK